MEFATICGWIASVSMVAGYMPQAIVTMRTRETDGIALPTFSMMAMGSLFFIIQGVLLGNWPLAVTNIITGTCSAIVFSIKIYNDYFKKKK